MSDLPAHLESYAQDTRDLLGLQAWAITFRVVDEIDGDPGTAGQCQYKEPYRVARILLRRDQSDDDMRGHIMHELLHCALAHYDVTAIRIAGMLPKDQRRGALQLLDDACERTVVALTAALRSGINPPADAGA